MCTYVRVCIVGVMSVCILVIYIPLLVVQKAVLNDSRYDLGGDVVQVVLLHIGGGIRRVSRYIFLLPKSK